MDKPIQKMNIQLFAEGEGVTKVTFDDLESRNIETEPAEEEEIPSDSNTGEEVKQESEETPSEEEEFDEIVYNKDKVKIPKSERQTYLQKGYNYDKVKQKADQYTDALTKAAKLTGFETVDDYLAAIDKAEKEAQEKKYKEAGIQDPKVLDEIINNHPVIKQATAVQMKAAVEKQKSELKDKRFFKELEPEIDSMIEQSPGIDVRTVYNYLIGERIDELLAKATDSTKKSTIADMQDKAKRSVGNINSDTSDEEVQPTKSMSEIASVFGIQPKNLAKRLAQNNKRR